MKNFIESILTFFERRTYGVCQSIANHMGVRAHRVRLSFIYLSFITFGSPIFVYIVLMFWKSNRHIFFFTKGRRSVWE
ncbi:MAG: PspC domain-containing protein [Flavobacteriales bacterium]|nr:PspC domain-containing protein [Flavobacteriales bacterium]